MFFIGFIYLFEKNLNNLIMYLQCLIFWFHKELYNYLMSDSQQKIVYCWIKLIILLFYVFISWMPCKGKLRYIRKT